MSEQVTISHRGAGYEIGRGPGFYGIWTARAANQQPLEWWPETTEGWQAAWTRFSALEVPGTIFPAQPLTTPVAKMERRPLIASVLLAGGVVVGFAGLFPHYLGTSSLASQAAQVLPHVVYLAVWAASAVLIGRGGTGRRVGALLGIGLSIVTFGMFFSDAGTVIAGGSHLLGAGLVLSLIGWCACAAGSWIALGFESFATATAPPRYQIATRIALTIAALGTAIAFAPAWDTFTLHTAAGATHSLSAGNAFSTPAPVIAGNVAVMVAFFAVVVAAAFWRPLLLGSALLIGAIIPMAAQAISALVQLGESTSPSLFGITSAQASQVGLTIDAGVTAVFWIYVVFVVAAIVVWARLLIPPRAVAPPAVSPAAGPYGGAWSAQEWQQPSAQS